MATMLDFLKAGLDPRLPAGVPMLVRIRDACFEGRTTATWTEDGTGYSDVRGYFVVVLGVEVSVPVERVRLTERTQRHASWTLGWPRGSPELARTVADMEAAAAGHEAALRNGAWGA